MTDNYYPTHDGYEPTARLTVHWDSPTANYQDGETIKHERGPRKRLIIEGESDYIERIYQAAKTTIDQIRAEIDPA